VYGFVVFGVLAVTQFQDLQGSLGVLLHDYAALLSHGIGAVESDSSLQDLHGPLLVGRAPKSVVLTHSEIRQGQHTALVDSLPELLERLLLVGLHPEPFEETGAQVVQSHIVGVQIRTHFEQFECLLLVHFGGDSVCIRLKSSLVHDA